MEQAKADNTSENFLNEVAHVIYSLFKQKKLIEIVQQYNEFNKIAKQNGYYLYKF